MNDHLNLKSNLKPNLEPYLEINLECIILCAGSGSRLTKGLIETSHTPTPKQFLEIAGKPLFSYALFTFLKWQTSYQQQNLADQTLDHTPAQMPFKIKNIHIYLVAQPEQAQTLEQMAFQAIKTSEFNCAQPIYPNILATGGQTRQESVLNTLEALLQKKIQSKNATSNINSAIDLNASPTPSWVLVHDSARPYLHIEDLNQLIQSLAERKQNPDFQGAILVKKVYDTVKMVQKTTDLTTPHHLHANLSNNFLKTLNREALFFAQTPQLFELNTLCAALQYSQQMQQNVTDEAQAIELYFQNQLQKPYHIQPVESKYCNDKITVLEDWQKLQNVFE